MIFPNLFKQFLIFKKVKTTNNPPLIPSFDSHQKIFKFNCALHEFSGFILVDRTDRFCFGMTNLIWGSDREGWGEFVDAKINAPELLIKEIKKKRVGRVWVSGVCDPYQPLEASYGLTRRCLKELARKQFPVTIQTKSKLALRDLDLFQEFEQIEVGFTITTDDERVVKLFEPRASSVEERLKALESILSSGIKTFAFVGPLLPGNPKKLIERLEEKVDKIFIDKMNYLFSVRGFYHQLGLEREMTDRFFREYKERLIYQLKKRKMKFEVLF